MEGRYKSKETKSEGAKGRDERNKGRNTGKGRKRERVLRKEQKKDRRKES